MILQKLPFLILVGRDWLTVYWLPTLVGRDWLTVYWLPTLGERNKLTVFRNIVLKTCLETVEKVITLYFW